MMSAGRCPRLPAARRRRPGLLAAVVTVALVALPAPAAAVTAGGGSGHPLSPATPAQFDDAADTPFADDIAWLADEGITTGYDDGTFRPENKVTREAMAAFLYRLAGEPGVDGAASFDDIDDDSNDFAEEIAWAEQEGITSGYDDGRYRPKKKITREAMAAFLYRFAGEPSVDGDEPSFSDHEKTSFGDEISWLADQKITTGYCDGTFRPKNTITREATAAFLHRSQDSSAAPEEAECDSTDSITLGPADAVTIRGHGFGHGKGLSQYGAQGAALDGESHGTILDHYYPHTGRDNVGDETLRVWLEDDDEPWTTVEAQDSLKFESPNESKHLPNQVDGDTVQRWRIAAQGPDSSLLWYQTDGSDFQKYADVDSWGSAASFTAGSAGSPLTLVTPDGDEHEYRGSLTAVPDGSDQLTVNEVDLEDYLQGVVAREMPASWHEEALRAQAIAARTYSLSVRQSGADYDLCDSEACQVYTGVDGEETRTNDAVAKTSGEIITYENKPAFTQFSASSGGYTADGGRPYLRVTEDDWDDWEGNGYHDWSETVQAETIEDEYPQLGTLEKLTITERSGAGDMGGRVAEISLIGSSGEQLLTGDEARLLFGLPSNWFGF